MNDRHSTVIEINVDDQQALNRIKQVQQALDRLQQTADRLNIGGGGGPGGPGGGGGGGPGGGGGGPGQPPSPRPPTDQNQAGRGPRQSFAQQFGVAAISSLNGFSGGTPFTLAAQAVNMFGQRYGPQGSRGGGTGGGGGGNPPGPTPPGGGQGGSRAVSGISRAAGQTPIIGAGLQAIGEAVNAQMQRVQQYASVERTRAIAGLTGGVAALGTGAQFGMSPEQAAQIQQQYGATAGYAGANIGASALRLSNAGVSMGAAGALGRTLGPGGGGIGGSGIVSRVAGQAFGMGLRGSRVDEYLQTIASGIGQMSQQGMSVNVENVAQFAGSVGAGIRGALAATKLMSPIQQGRQQLLAPFQGMMGAAVQARAFSRAGEFGGGFKGVLQAYQEMGERGPISTVEATRSLLGDDIAALATAGQGGLSLEEAERGVAAVRTGEFAKVGGPLPQAVTAATAPATMKLAAHQAEIMKATEKHLQASLDLLDIVQSIELFMQSLANSGAELVAWMKKL